MSAAAQAAAGRPAEAVNPLQRNDFRVLVELVEPNSRVLDLGCGDGALLALLREHKQATCYGVEMDPDGILACIGKGLSVFQGNLDEGLRDFEDQSFDYVVSDQSLTEVRRPEFMMREMLRVGKKAVFCFPNFAHWRIRLQLLFRGRMPVDEVIPFQWFETPNIHHLTVADFRAFCRHHGMRVLDQYFFRSLRGGRVSRAMAFPNWSAAYALFVTARR
ncbi:MAG: methionine biosynthesis protein MetW [Lentisphaeria bacterium]|jgi:methionine biosynthesis protein MetW